MMAERAAGADGGSDPPPSDHNTFPLFVIFLIAC